MRGWSERVGGVRVRGWGERAEGEGGVRGWRERVLIGCVMLTWCAERVYNKVCGVWCGMLHYLFLANYHHHCTTSLIQKTMFPPCLTRTYASVSTDCHG